MKNKFSFVMLCLFLTGGFYNLWTLRPVKILYVYSDAGWTVTMVVDHLPWTDRDKIGWYLAHREEMKRKYPLFDDTWHTYNIMGVGNGFTNYDSSPDEDLLCFPTIKNDNSCIARNYLLIINEYTDSNTRLYVPDSDVVYQLTSENKLEVVPPPDGSG
ncbi:DUF943 family protein [Trabulsiella odontotermitis]|uniref:DUF943 family protein n=1 Tax=Trabulsiella odontotermitis TaxID=379893 RepID=UPI00092F4F7D|nr:DUF943 family protein [Trabulsiella odontotermitis]